ncbi:NADH dehydrogenase subunit 4L [Tanacetum coccineum]|uniref:NADH dehydrogenase subunit 4L n=1 Tax=Tanacetum coccineum TaxID=301880 RepID=A0ABQ4X4N6_9ASTR
MAASRLPKHTLFLRTGGSLFLLVGKQFLPQVWNPNPDQEGNYIQLDYHIRDSPGLSSRLSHFPLHRSPDLDLPFENSVGYPTELDGSTIVCIRGILLNRRNIPIMSMPIESMLLAVNSNFLVFSVSSDDMMGQSFASLVPTVAAAESAIGLAIFVITFRVRGTIAVESINSIQGGYHDSEGDIIYLESLLID